MTRRLLLACLLAAATLPLWPSSAAAATACGFDASEDNYEFTGAVSNDWSVAGNWDRGIVPGEVFSLLATTNDQACIPAGKTAEIGGTADDTGVKIDLRRLVSDGIVTVNRGSKLWINGDSSHPSRARAVNQLASTIGGHGKLTITGWLHWTSLENGAATQTTREVLSDHSFIGGDPEGTPGRTVIAPGAQLLIDGPFGACTPCGGVNLYDRRFIDNFGTTTLSKAGYVAADAGTTFTNFRTSSAIGRLVIANNRGWYQGFTGPPNLINAGTITKTAGTGVSILDVNYTRTLNGHTGTVSVAKGTLQIWSDFNTVTVSPGATFGTAGCATEQSPTCNPEATTANTQAEVVKLPAITGAPSAPVAITELTTMPPPNTIGREVTINTPGAAASSTEPMLFTFLYDATVVPVGFVASNYRVLRDDVPLGPCPATGTGSAVACTASIGFTTAGDLKVVVRTTDNSKFCIRKLYSS
ncbi:MAG TPA: hypothetical protein VMZ22_14040 [Acidimicrobiales bacterium]|nr:hypothetical protein [Acidimicrobiales bacterium]